MKVLKTFGAGVPLSKLACFHELLEENSLRLTDRSNLSKLISFLGEEA